MISRRDLFLGTMGAAVLALVKGCKSYVPVLKVPENVDEIADLFRFFTRPDFELEQAKAGLGVTGEPRIHDDPRWRKIFTYEFPTGSVERIALQIGGRDHREAGRLNSISIDYRSPITVSLRHLESYLGAADIRIRKIPVPPGSSISMFTNLMPGQKEKEIASYSFDPAEPIAEGHLKGALRVTCDHNNSDSKAVNSLDYTRELEKI